MEAQEQDQMARESSANKAELSLQQSVAAGTHLAPGTAPPAGCVNLFMRALMSTYDIISPTSASLKN